MSHDVRIEIHMRMAEVTPPLEELVRPSLTCAEHETIVDASGSIKSSANFVRWYSLFADHIEVFAGHVPRLVRDLEARGYTCELVDHRYFGEGYLPDSAFVEKSSGRQRGLLEALAPAARGQVMVDTQRQRNYVLKAICLLYRKSTILVVIARAQDGHRLADELERMLGEPVAPLIKDPFSDHRVQIIDQATYRSTSNFNYVWPVQVFLGETCANQGVVNNSEGWTRSRIFAISRRRTYTPREELMREALAGPVIYRWSPLPVEFSEVLVTWCRLNNRRSHCDDSLARKRNMIWKHQARNQVIASLAQAFLNKDVAALSDVDLRALDLRAWFDAFDYRPRTMILVETVEHAENLRVMLDGWRVLTAVPVSDQSAQQDWSSRTSSIVTIGFAELNGFDADVVIRADGTGTTWRDTWLSPRTGRYRRSPMIVVDIADAFDERALHDTAERKSCYERLGWLVSES